MKKFCITFLTIAIIILSTVWTGTGLSERLQEERGAFSGQTEYFRIHIRADSNEAEAQAVKYLVRDAIVYYLTPLVAASDSKEDTMSVMKRNLAEIAATAERTLRLNGYTYGARAEIGKEEFPTRVYGGETLAAGEYDALIVYLGRGEGDNWWCVLYPPLCFASPTGENIVYKSKIEEIIDRWRQGQD